MRDYSAAFFALLGMYLKALFTPARGRHSAAARRRRSTRVRPYAPAPVEATAPPVPKPVFAVDPARAQAEATARLHGWIPKQRPPGGDLLAAPVQPTPGEFDELAALVRTWQRQRMQQAQRRAAVAV
ncbi:hypothetical protein BJF83_14185 [Nocardiopsis sp. CNR-923]|uniref:hypothetical protein n=1 Tax=Nocardiopsis sp. CNR-923 TaxID=1904965 RepID=UPI00095B5886|nr:hypothetical protein [Nocardiopsis sp. CNR-923]OLT28780.1 hypothetical protein BJF83_14185 [Nocardiopsis sp. CNR-923]